MPALWEVRDSCPDFVSLWGEECRNDETGSEVVASVKTLLKPVFLPFYPQVVSNVASLQTTAYIPHWIGNY